jgi:hypothetical protein
MRKLVLLLPLLCSCGILDFGGDAGKDWEFIAFWDQGPSIGEEDPENPGYDKDGNKIVSPEVVATYTFPDIHAGYAWLDGKDEDPIMTPTINLELAEFKVPYLRWFNIQAGAGAGEAHIYVGKRFTSIIEITAGPLMGYRFDENEWVFGIQGTLIKW